MSRQNFRKLVLILSLLLFPVTLYYFSPALILNAGLHGIINGSFLVFLLLFLLSIPFGRVFCGWICPAGGLQECLFSVSEKRPRQGWRNGIKYAVWGIWMSGVILCYFLGGGIRGVDLLYETEGGISVSSLQSYLIYYGILCLIIIPALVGGKRAFCHYFCWMAPFMVLGGKIRRLFRLPSLRIRAEQAERCVSCGQCSRACPMGIDVAGQIRKGGVSSDACILCGACADRCPHKVIRYGMGRENYGKEAGLCDSGTAQP